MILGQAAGEAVVLARAGGALFAIGAECTHYHGPLAEGMLVADTVRCPWHHAGFSLRTGEALRAPALDPVACWRVDQRAGFPYTEPFRHGFPAMISTLLAKPATTVQDAVEKPVFADCPDRGTTAAVGG
jgi:nitrite reductase/ring-hydroxylating ferredoxin subunit